MDRPRRTTRPPVKAPSLLVPEPARIQKRKPQEYKVDPEKQLKTLLTSSKSDLVSLDMTDIVNVQTWSMLSDESRAQLQTLLPPTAFWGYQETIGNDHPSLQVSSSRMQVDDDSKPASLINGHVPELNHLFFNDAHFLSSMRTFQDHLFLNWFTDAHVEKVKKFQDGILDGTLAAPWKDEVWERDNQPTSLMLGVDIAIKGATPSGASFTSSTRAGGATEVKLGTLAKKGIIRVGDVIAYKKTFALQNIIVEKDLIIESIHPTSNSVTLLTTPGCTKDLPEHLLHDPSSSESLSASEQPRSLTITAPQVLENAVLDLDGRVDKQNRPNGNAWKCCTVWRWRPGMEYLPETLRGGRENHGTLFYLRGSYYHER